MPDENRSTDGTAEATATEPRSFTVDEARAMFLDHVDGVVRYWQAERRVSREDAIRGVAFSLLAMLDGCSVEMPAWRVICDPHPDDAMFHFQRGENWWPMGADISDEMLHDAFGARSHRYPNDGWRDGPPETSGWYEVETTAERELYGRHMVVRWSVGICGGPGVISPGLIAPWPTVNGLPARYRELVLGTPPERSKQ